MRELSRDVRKYLAWGVVVGTGNVRGAHLANGIVQLLRTASNPVPWRNEQGEPLAPGDYLQAVQTALRERFGGGHDLNQAQRAFCVTRFKYGRIQFEHPNGTDFEGATDAEKRLVDKVRKMVDAGRRHVSEQLHLPGDAIQPRIHRALASVLNADDRVKVTGASDPTTSGFRISGITTTHTLRGMHAATFLGLLAATVPGTHAIRRIHALLADESHDPHSALVNALRLSGTDHPPPNINPFMGLYPLPTGKHWLRWAELAGSMSDRLLRWSEAGASKAETWTGVVDLATLLLALQLLRWRRDSDETEKLILVISESETSGSRRSLVDRAQVSLLGVQAGLDRAAEDDNLVGGDLDDDRRKYWPGPHALNLAASGGWLRPHDSRGGAKRYFAPGPRQFTTLVRALIDPGEEPVSWSEFSDRAEGLGLALGGLREHSTAQRLHTVGGAATVRLAGIVNKNHLVALGLARRESDDVVKVDGGAHERH